MWIVIIFLNGTRDMSAFTCLERIRFAGFVDEAFVGTPFSIVACIKGTGNSPVHIHLGEPGLAGVRHWSDYCP